MMNETTQNETKTLIRNARVLWAKGDLSGAKTSYDRAFETTQPGNHLLAEYSLLIYRTMDTEEIANAWESSWEGKNKDPLYWNEIGVNQMDRGNTPDAVEAFRCAARLSPGNSRILGNLAMAMACGESGPEVRDQLEWVIDQFPTEVRAHYLLGMLSEKSIRISAGKLLYPGQKVTLSRGTQLLCDSMPQEWETRILKVTDNEITMTLTNGTRGFTPLRPGARIFLGLVGITELWGGSTEILRMNEEGRTVVTVQNPRTFVRIQRRNNVRIEAGHFIRQISLPQDHYDGNGFENIDISAGGIGFETTRKISTGAIISIDLAIGSGITRVEGTVVRKVRRGSDRFQIGVSFSDLAPNTHDAIAKIIHQVQLATPKKSTRAANEGPRLEINGYRILEKIGSGAMGSVFRATQLSMNRVVALKVLPPKNATNERIRQRFLRESRVLATLNHPNIISGIDAGETGGLHHFSMEYFAGRSVGNLLATTGTIDVTSALSIITRVARALSHASSKGIIHRDIKPDNILVDGKGNVKLCDFGISRIDRETGTWKTNPGTKMGTPHYISPEQALGSTQVDGRSDLYSLGITFYHMVVGSVPFSGKNPVQVIARHISEPIPSPRDRNNRIPVEIDYIIRKMTRKQAKDRYANASDLLQDLEEVCRGNLPHSLKKEMTARRIELDLAS